MEAASNEESSVVVLIEADPRAWTCSERAGGLDLKTFVQNLIIFIRAIRLLHVDNRIALIASVGNASHFLGNVPAIGRREDERSETDVQAILRRLRDAVANAVDERPTSGFSGAFARALCHINKAREEGASQTPRILFLRLSGDENTQYVSTMNCIFCAQKQKVTVDACMMGQDDSPYLQQAAYLTGGIYLRVSEPKGLLQYLMMTFITDLHSRKRLNMPKQRAIDFRASCFCHRRPIDIGHVCTVCLSIFCENVPQCTTCGVKFVDYA